MVRDGVVSSVCSFCYSGCGVLIHLQDGAITRIEGNPDAPINKGVLCPKGWASLDVLNHPGRIRKPLRRVGKRGEGRWEEITWDKALGVVASQLNQAKAQHGAESVLFLRGAAKGLQDNVFTRLANAFGSPNITSPAFVCFVPRINAANVTSGSFLLPDYDQTPACILVWGSNPEATCVSVYKMITAARSKGTKLIVIDPKETTLARSAALWLKPRPGSDLALALAFLHVIIAEELFDQSFVTDWCVGFDALREHVAHYSPEKVEEMTSVSADLIRDAAILYATTRPAVIQPGNALEQTGHSFQTPRALCILEAVTGNVGVPGGTIEYAEPPLANRGTPEFTLQALVPTEKRDRRHGAEFLAPFSKYALAQAIVRAIIEDKPDRPRAAYVQGGNLLVTWPNARETRTAFEKLDFLAVADLFMTPTAQVADVVLPVASYLEFDAISYTMEFPWVAQAQQKVADCGEAWPDIRIMLELGKKLGLGGLLWKDEDTYMADLLKPAGITFDDLKKSGFIYGGKNYRHFERAGFRTPSGKVELYSPTLAEWGYDPLPTYREALDPCIGDPDSTGAYPLVVTSWKPPDFRHSSLRQVESLRRNRPEPLLEINPKTAGALGIREGDRVYIETRFGKIEHKAKLAATLHPGVVIIDHGWWYPERGAGSLDSFADASANALTNNKEPRSPEMGTPILRGLPCKVYKA